MPRPRPTKEHIEKVALSRNLIIDASMYNGSYTKMNYTCKIDNYQGSITWDRLKQGRGCPKCAGKLPPTKEHMPATLYYGKIVYKEREYHKIGITNRDPIKRLKAAHPEFELVKEVKYLFGYIAKEDEAKILKKHARYLTNDLRKFLNSGHTEIFSRNVLGW